MQGDDILTAVSDFDRQIAELSQVVSSMKKMMKTELLTIAWMGLRKWGVMMAMLTM